ncbi:hypothetical protein HYC85_003793 [Camellia sinensis]|uniref:Uncharacterized protein n=1 Tax=Camellia sinensis TaxID=4442 RepID=A0A7J7HXB7_CAMSI|nr:hypothetical protein HYC85_003793 [Camellia sinensis]
MSLSQTIFYRAGDQSLPTNKLSSHTFNLITQESIVYFNCYEMKRRFEASNHHNEKEWA